MTNGIQSCYSIPKNDEWIVFLEAYRSYEIQLSYNAIYISSSSKDSHEIKERHENRIFKLEDWSYEKLIKDFGEKFTESFGIKLKAEGHYDFFELFELMFTKKRSI